MNERYVSVVFDTYQQAETAAAELRSSGVKDDAISIIAQNPKGKTVETDGSEEAVEKGGNAVKGALGGAAVGTVLGLAALAIPGVGPFVAAGAIASAAIPGAMATGAAIGAVGGGLMSLLGSHGVDETDAKYFEERITSGGVFVSVDTTSGPSYQNVSEILFRNGGHNSGTVSATGSPTSTKTSYA